MCVPVGFCSVFLPPYLFPSFPPSLTSVFFFAHLVFALSLSLSLNLSQLLDHLSLSLSLSS